jgi:FKBP-type peptidyl-prolyl cis-trans isomerase FkpA
LRLNLISFKVVIMNKKLITIFIFSSLLTSCTTKTSQNLDTSIVDDRLKVLQARDASVVSDITSSSQKEDRSQDPDNVEIKNIDYGEKTDDNTNQDFSTKPDMPTTPQPLTTVNELLAYDEVIGTGAEAVTGSTVSVHYTGTLTNGQKFDSSLDRDQPFQFTLGGGQVIKGWDDGVVGMKVGGKRRLTIPANLAYGDRAVGQIPAGATLIFDIELLAVQ